MAPCAPPNPKKSAAATQPTSSCRPSRPSRRGCARQSLLELSLSEPSPLKNVPRSAPKTTAPSDPSSQAAAPGLTGLPVPPEKTSVHPALRGRRTTALRVQLRALAQTRLAKAAPLPAGHSQTGHPAAVRSLTNQPAGNSAIGPLLVAPSEPSPAAQVAHLPPSPPSRSPKASNGRNTSAPP